MKIYVTREQIFYEVFEVEIDPEDFDGDQELIDQAAMDDVDSGDAEETDSGFRGNYSYEVETA